MSVNRVYMIGDGVEIRTGCWRASAAVGLLLGSGSSSFLMKSFAIRATPRHRHTDRRKSASASGFDGRSRERRGMRSLRTLIRNVLPVPFMEVDLRLRRLLHQLLDVVRPEG